MVGLRAGSESGALDTGPECWTALEMVEVRGRGWLKAVERENFWREMEEEREKER